MTDHILYATDKNYCELCAVSLYSLLSHLKGEAVIHIIESNLEERKADLQKIADDLALTYMNMNSGNTALRGAVDVIKESSKTVIETGDGAEIHNDIYYFFAIPLAIMLLIELVLIVRRGRI